MIKIPLLAILIGEVAAFRATQVLVLPRISEARRRVFLSVGLVHVFVLAAAVLAGFTYLYVLAPLAVLWIAIGAFFLREAHHLPRRG